MSPSRGGSSARRSAGWWRRLHWACRLLVLAVLLLARPDTVLSAADEGQKKNQSEASVLHVADTGSNDGAGSLYVSLLDGTVHAIEPSTGSIQWSFSSGAPLVSSSRQFGSAEDLENADGHIFPGADGVLYAYRQNQPLQRLPLTVKELVELGPSMTPDGALLYGELRTTVYELDAGTGALQQTHYSRSDLGTSMEADDDALVLRNKGMWVAAQLCIDADVPDNPSFVMRPPGQGRTVLIGRKDYTVRSVERSTGVEHWNLSFSQVAPITPHHGGVNAIGPPASESSSQHLIVDAYKHLHSTDVNTGWDAWSVEFMTQPVAYFMGSGQPLLLAPDAEIDQHGSVMVGLMGGQLYALPSPEHAVMSSRRALDDAPYFEVPDLSEHSTVLMPFSFKSAQQQQWLCLVENYTATNAPDMIHRPQTKRRLPQLPAANSSSMPSKALPAADGESLGERATVFSSIASLHSGIWALLGAAASLSVVYARRLLKQRRSGALRPSIVVTTPNKPAKRKKSKKASNLPVKSSLADDDQIEAVAVKSPGDSAGAREARTKLLNSGSGKLAVDNLPPGAIRVGRLVVGPRVLGYGSHGTVVYDGKLDGRTVAVKRLLGQFYETAQKEINTLIVTDEHPNIIRCYAMEEDNDFVYVALERCARNLTDLVTAACNRAPLPDVKSSSSGETLEVVVPDGDGCIVPEWLDANQVPTTFNMQIMRDVVAGLAHLHCLGVVHRDIKPHNVLISRQNRAKLSDMGISKRLVDEQSSFDTHGGAAAGSAGWMAPETLRDGRKTRAVDNFSLGCLLYFCMTGGHHPFGENRYERDANILRGRPDLWLIQHMPEAHDLVTRLLQPDPSLRLSAEEALLHPFFWPPEVRLAFLIDISDRVEGEDRVLNSTILGALESRAPVALGGPWDSFLDYDLLDNLGKYRKYNMQSVRDLLRVIRNKCHHYRELPPELQNSLGAIPEGYVSYFTKRFPRLLLEMYAFAQEQCSHEAAFQKYFRVLPGPS
eukprot:jgi/Chlat1/191/Chrsp1S03110